ncbi:MAG: hypothetical protein Q9163_003508 [Psora crenata]
MPLTPSASTDIAGRDAAYPPSTEPSFNLPPPAMQPNLATTTVSNHRSIQPAASPNYSLPPPPTRSRTIIQMTPKTQQSSENAKRAAQPGPKGPNKRARAAPNATPGSKKQTGSTSAAGKKVARKTAHSVIERRRRSKMNEEFATLKGMIPACTGQEMHKLAILQASIDYLSYLESCISELKAANNALATPLVQPQAPVLRKDNGALLGLDEDDDELAEDDDDNDEDTAMKDVGTITTQPTRSVHPKRASAYASPQSITTSPSTDSQARYQSSYASSLSTLPSPAMGPQLSCPQSQHSYSGPQSVSTSPTIMPSREQDEEATAALLMLNKDRRYSKEEGKRRLSVRDLLTS